MLLHRSDSDIQKDVSRELSWEPGLMDDDVAVAVRDGVVTLAGFVHSYADKFRAERVASRVKGVKGIANDLEVRLPTSSERPDPEIARTAVDALRWDILVPEDRITVTVRDGWVTLEGDVDWYFQKEAAERAVRNLAGVRGVTSLVAVKQRPAASDIKQKIQEALERGAEFDASRITVEVHGNRVTLRGTVRSYAEKRDAERAALNAPGVTVVENEITVDPSVYAGV